MLRPRAGRVLPGYLYLLARSEPVVEVAVSSSAGSRMPRTDAADLLAVRVPLPPLAEQRRIVDLIGRFDDVHQGVDAVARSAAIVAGVVVEDMLAQAWQAGTTNWSA